MVETYALATMESKLIAFVAFVWISVIIPLSSVTAFEAFVLFASGIIFLRNSILSEEIVVLS